LVDNPGIARIFDQWVQAGHHVANHTHRHPIFDAVSAEEYKDQIALADKYLDPWLSQAPKKFFRYTLNLWGDTEEKLHSVKEYLDKNGYTISEVTSWFYEWEYNYAYWACLLNSDKDGMEFIKKSFLDYSIAQLKYDNEASKKWFGREIPGIALVHTVPLFSDIAEAFLKLLNVGFEGTLFNS
jgi:peptidoglycan/xylan/chitin deacetylase (PgdA/CDA1 family)